MEEVHIERKPDLNSNVNACSSENNLSEASTGKFTYATLLCKKRFEKKF